MWPLASHWCVWTQKWKWISSKKHMRDRELWGYVIFLLPNIWRHSIPESWRINKKTLSWDLRIARPDSISLPHFNTTSIREKQNLFFIHCLASQMSGSTNALKQNWTWKVKLVQIPKNVKTTLIWVKCRSWENLEEQTRISKYGLKESAREKSPKKRLNLPGDRGCDEWVFKL